MLKLKSQLIIITVLSFWLNYQSKIEAQTMINHDDLIAQGHDHHDHEMPNNNTPISTPNNTNNTNNTDHTDHSQHNMSSEMTTRAELTFENAVYLDDYISYHLVINIYDKTGKSINDFEMVHEKLMHLIIVSDDLEYFQHIHPIYMGNGRFEVVANLPISGTYTIYSDYKPQGESPQVAVMKLMSDDPTPTNIPPFFISNTHKIIQGIDVSLNIQQVIQNNSNNDNTIPVTLTFNLKSIHNFPLRNLQPFLGEKAHLIMIRQSRNLDRQDYVHVHPTDHNFYNAENMTFHSVFQQAGNYKMWLQFKYDDQIITADFLINIRR